ncbi:MAG: DUF4037 domain-containing protein [Bacteroidales bacterium]|nr:DUF4037 domain-containing protein [Bacteroidales bacterium]MCM1415946.1 DUF4037 domain-containing protein [bacterium]MCM1423552.1 DUF4037 domain-containing protein [bacterium]
MKGLELSQNYYETYGRAMIDEQFPDIADQTAAGLVGYGSECMGYDDEISRDHDYGSSFCIWLPREVYARCGKAVQAAYDALPKEFMGFAARVEEAQGKGRVGALCMEDFYRGILGTETLPETDVQWLSIPEEALAAAVNGSVFEDRLGRFTAFRQGLLLYYPESVWRRKLADALAKAAQAGQYNYARAMRRGECVAAELALSEFVRESIHLVYLLNRTYAPFYKWMHRGLQELSVGAEIGDMLVLLYRTQEESDRVLIIEAVCNVLAQILREMGLSAGEDNFLQSHVEEVLKN